MSTLATAQRAFTARRVGLFLIVLLVLVSLASALRPDALDVETAVAHHAPLRVTVDSEGVTRVRERYVITAPVVGRLERVPLAEGDVIQAGDVVARIAPAPIDAASARQARARLEAARALEQEALSRVRLAADAVAQAERDVSRARRLHEAGGLARQALEQAELSVRSRTDDHAAAQARAAAAAAEVEQARAALLHAGSGSDAVVAVHSPAGGRVLRLAGRSERVIVPGSIIAEVGDIGGLEVVVDVLSSQAAAVRPNMHVMLEGWGGDEPVSGTVRLVEPSAITRVSALGVEEQRVDVIVDVPAPPHTLGDGYRVDARIAVWEADSVLVIPASALVRSGAQWRAFVLQGDRANSRALRIGRMGGAQVQVLDGLAAGDEVIAFPSDKVKDGVRIKRRGVAPVVKTGSRSIDLWHRPDAG